MASNKKEPEATTEGQKLFQRIKVKDYPLKDWERSRREGERGHGMQERVKKRGNRERDFKQAARGRHQRWLWGLHFSGRCKRQEQKIDGKPQESRFGWWKLKILQRPSVLGWERLKTTRISNVLSKLDHLELAKKKIRNGKTEQIGVTDKFRTLSLPGSGDMWDPRSLGCHFIVSQLDRVLDDGYSSPL